MLMTRVMPCLLLRGLGLVKTIKFKNPTYIGDPINAVMIYNTKEVDELIFLDITATKENKKPNTELIRKIANECFMPFAYGGGIRDLKTVKKIFNLGTEKIVVNTKALESPNFIGKVSKIYGSQSIIVSIDVKKNLFGKYEVFSHARGKSTGLDPVDFAVKMEKIGAGEIFLNSVDRDGTMEGYDIELIKKVSEAVSIPVIACGGAGKVEDFGKAVKIGGASAVAAGSMFVFHGRRRAVLINFPTREELEKVLG